MKKITELLNSSEKAISIEVFPPKALSSFETVRGAAEKMADLDPLFMSVTYGAGGGTSEFTIALAKHIQDRKNIPVLNHLTCVSSSRETVRKRIEDIHEAGITNIMSLRGDIPQERLSEDRSKWDYRYAVDLIREIKASGHDFCLGGGCYPEKHPESESLEKDIEALKIKVDAGCDFLTTQLFFDNTVFYEFVEKIRAKGIEVPVLPGIMPITNIKMVDRCVKMSGSRVPERMTAFIEKYENDPEGMFKAGIEYAGEQIEDIYDHGFSKIHLYSMNKPEVAEKIFKL